MRHFLIALMIALLPVRGWVGEAMAFSMPGGPAATASHAGCPDHAAPAQAAGMLEALAPLADNSTTDDGSHQHNACDVCNGPVLSLAAWQDDAAPAPHHVQAAPDVRFASLVPPRRHKPPIA